MSVNSTGSEADGSSGKPSISGDGRFVVFYSSATNLITNDTIDGIDDIFLHDRKTGKTSKISTEQNGSSANDNSYDPFISEDGKYIAFETAATNLTGSDTNNSTDVFLFGPMQYSSFTWTMFLPAITNNK